MASSARPHLRRLVRLMCQHLPDVVHMGLHAIETFINGLTAVCSMTVPAGCPLLASLRLWPPLQPPVRAEVGNCNCWLFLRRRWCVVQQHRRSNNFAQAIKAYTCLNT